MSQLQHRAEQDEEEKDKIKQRMTGFVSQEKEKFERLATHMKTQQRDLLAKSAQIQQVSGREGGEGEKDAVRGGRGGRRRCN